MGVRGSVTVALWSWLWVVAGPRPTLAYGDGGPVAGARREKPMAVAAGGASDELIVKARAIFGRLPDRMPGSREDTPAMIRLGERLFFEKGLSVNRTQSCNTCHRVDGNRAGVDNMATSTGAHAKRGARNSPTVFNAGYQVAQFWDGRAADLVEQARGPMLNPMEMAMPDEKTCLERLREPPYPQMFREAFPNQGPCTLKHAARTIAAFEHTLVSRSRFDDFLDGDRGALAPQERQGLALFMELGCTSCHHSQLVGGTLLNKAGIFHPYKNQRDAGRFAITERETDRFVFKVPSLRNVTLTAPYFHDGQVATLAEAVDLMAWMQLDKKLSVRQIELLLRFLTSLADTRRTTAPPSAADRPKWRAPETARLLGGEAGELVRRGHALLCDTCDLLGPAAGDPTRRFSGSGLSCGDCHPNEGAKPYGIPWVGVTFHYPRVDFRFARKATLEDRINDCMVRSLNGRPLPDNGGEMKAMVAYMTWLSRDVDKSIAGRRTPGIAVPDRAADPGAGAEVFGQHCQSCHAADGSGYRPLSAGAKGRRVTPPLWGAESFNTGAGMHRVLTAAGFIKGNMPLGTPWDRPVLTDEQAYDVAAYINSLPRPAMEGLERDYPDRSKKPVDCPYPPYADDFPQSQHQFGPFPPILKAREKARENQENNASTE